MRGSMRVLVTDYSLFDNCKYPLDLSGLHTYSATDVEGILAPCFKNDGSCSCLSLDFEGEEIPITCRDELRLVSRLVSVYHNACVDADHSLRASDNEIAKLQADMEKLEKEVSETSETVPCVDKVQSSLYKDRLLTPWRSRRKARKFRLPTHDSWHEESNDSWDEERDGNQWVYDDEFELNEELTDKMIQNNKQSFDEKFGMYL